MNVIKWTWKRERRRRRGGRMGGRQRSPAKQPLGPKHLCAASHPISQWILHNTSRDLPQASTHKAECTVWHQTSHFFYSNGENTTSKVGIYFFTYLNKERWKCIWASLFLEALETKTYHLNARCGGPHHSNGKQSKVRERLQRQPKKFKTFR